MVDKTDQYAYVETFMAQSKGSDAYFNRRRARETQQAIPARLDAKNVMTFALAGNARLTFVSKETGTRFTFRIKQAKDFDEKPKQFWFVNLLNGADNESDFAYLGTINEVFSYYHGRKSKIGVDAPSAIAFDWLWHQIQAKRYDKLDASVEIWHEGKCGRCGRTLTVPESIASGYGPECVQYIEGKK